MKIKTSFALIISSFFTLVYGTSIETNSPAPEINFAKNAIQVLHMKGITGNVFEDQTCFRWFVRRCCPQRRRRRRTTQAPGSKN